MKRHWIRALLVTTLLGWSLGALPAVAQPADYAGDEQCTECHDEVVAALEGQIHMRIRSFEVQGRTVGCEGCHGPGLQHAEEGDPELIRTFATADAGDAACMECHQGKGLPQWHASTHAMEGVECLSCHSIHTASEPLDTCQSCHADVVGMFQLPSHHPVREGKMTCSSCHDTHAATEGLLRTRQRSNDLCYSCHQSLEGPFIFEHEPVQEDCGICHEPHGAVADALLNANEPTLCLQCHDFHFHSGYNTPDGEIEVGGTARQNPFGNRSFNVAFTTNCTQCHARIHGTDLPSQMVSNRGRGLIQ